MQIEPQSEAEWHALIAKLDAGKAETNLAFADQLSVSVAQDEIEGINVYHLAPAEVDPRHENHLFIYLHGGAFVLNAGEAGLAESIIIAHQLKMRVLHIDYRMPPQHPAPAGRDDVVSVYQAPASRKISTVHGAGWHIRRREYDHGGGSALD